MTQGKRFPLSLASLGERAKTSGVATPQTATRNRAQTSARQAAPAAEPARPMSMVSDAVRSAMVTRIARQGVRDEKVLAAMSEIGRAHV